MSPLMSMGTVLLAVLFGIFMGNVNQKIQKKNKKKQENN